jgi:preprotein translocase subunit SecE
MGMNKAAAIWKRMETFFNEVVIELKKCAWPTRPELINSTLVVIVSLIIFGVFIGISDTLVMKILEFVIR